MLSVSISSDSRWVVSGSKDRCVHVWDSNTATLQLLLQGHKNSGEFELYELSVVKLMQGSDLIGSQFEQRFARDWVGRFVCSYL